MITFSRNLALFRQVQMSRLVGLQCVLCKLTHIPGGCTLQGVRAGQTSFFRTDRCRDWLGQWFPHWFRNHWLFVTQFFCVVTLIADYVHWDETNYYLGGISAKTILQPHSLAFINLYCFRLSICRAQHSSGCCSLGFQAGFFSTCTWRDEELNLESMCSSADLWPLQHYMAVVPR